MTLTKRGKYWHSRFRFRGREFSASTKLTSHRDALAWESQWKANLALGVVGLEPAPIMRVAWEDWEAQAKGRVSQKHLDRARSAWRLHLEPIIGNLRADQIDAEVVAAVRRRYLSSPSRRIGAGQRTQSGANTLLGYLRAILGHLVRAGVLQRIPPFRIPRAQAPVRSYVPLARVREFLAAVDRTGNIHQSLAVRAMLFLGLREGEALGMRWEWFGPGLKTYTPGRTKGREALPLPVPQELRCWASGACFGCPPQFGLVMPSADGRPHRAGFCRAAIARSGIPGITAHRLRTSCATILAQAGVPVPTIQRQLRHRDIRTTLRYVEVGLADLQQASDRVWGVQNPHNEPAESA